MRKTATFCSRLLVIVSVLFPSAATIAQSGPDEAGKQASTNAITILFVGNSLASVNDLPKMIGELAKAADEERSFRPGRCLQGGFRFKDHWDKGEFQKAVKEKPWQIVVLQEQSALPSLDRARRDELMFPYARKLHGEIAQLGAKTLLYQTWGYQDGDHQNHPGDTFESMQDRLIEGYRELAEDLHAEVVPVGVAWRAAHQRNPQQKLWAEDGKHPTVAGTYLAACTFYGSLYGKSPVGNPFTSGLEKEEARLLQEAAASALRPSCCPGR